jgi:hypothetical protein
MKPLSKIHSYDGNGGEPPESEIEAMRKVASILEGLSSGACVRVLWWSLTRFCPHVPPDWVNKVLTWGLPEDDQSR